MSLIPISIILGLFYFRYGHINTETKTICFGHSFVIQSEIHSNIELYSHSYIVFIQYHGMFYMK